MSRRRAIVPMYADEHLTIDSTCYESLPCQHDVIYDGKGMRMDAKAILEYFEYIRKPVPLHFAYLLRTVKRQRL